MPALPRLRIEALADLARQLRFAPRATARRQMQRAAALASKIDPALNYPEDWLVHQVTGYRTEIAQPATIVGSALLADLSALVERLSVGAALGEPDLTPGKFLTLPQLRARWSVSGRTIERRRRQGLLAVRWRGRDGRERLAFPVPSVERFEGLHADSVRTAAAYSRLDAGARRTIVRRAAQYRRAGLPLNQAALRLSQRHGRAHETVRKVLRAHDAAATTPVFAERGRLSPREVRFLDRALRLGQEPAAVARRLGRPLATVRRADRVQRALRLRALGLPPTTAPALAATPRAAALLEGLGAPGPATLAGLLEAARESSPPAAVAERTLGGLYQGLVARCAGSIARLPRAPTAATLDRIETDLRTAVRVKTELVRSQLPLMVRTIEGAAGRRAEELRGPLLAPLVADCLRALAEAVDDFDPARARSGRLASPAGLAVTRVVSAWAVSHARALSVAPGRATPRAAADMPIADFTVSVAPWQAFLDPPRRVRAALPLLPEVERDALLFRLGWSGPAHTLAELAQRRGTTLLKAVMLERRALRAALRLASGIPGVRP